MPRSTWSPSALRKSKGELNDINRYLCQSQPCRNSRHRHLHLHLHLHPHLQPVQTTTAQPIHQELEKSTAPSPSPSPSSRRKAQSSTRRPFVCQTCDRAFTRRLTLKRHLQTHDGTKPFQCPICSKGLSRKHVLLQHLRVHSKRHVPFTCFVCTRHYTRLHDLGLEETIAGMANPRLICVHCLGDGAGDSSSRVKTPSSTSSPSPSPNRRRGPSSHQSNQHHLTVTGNGYNESRRHMLLSQVVSSQPNVSITKAPQASFECPYASCPKRYTQNGSLQAHIRSNHTGERPFSCRHCNRSFARKPSLKRHSLSHLAYRAHQCGVCSRAFTRKDALFQHLVRTHQS